MTSLLTDVMYRCQLPHRPQQRVGNPLQQVVFRLLALNLPAKANAAVSEPTTGRRNAASPDNVTGTHPHGDWRNGQRLIIWQIPANDPSQRFNHQPDAVRRGKQTRNSRLTSLGDSNLKRLAGNRHIAIAGVAPGHRINPTTRSACQAKTLAPINVSRTLTGSSEPDINTVIPAQAGIQKHPLPLGEGWGEGETEMQNPTSPMPTTPQPPRHDCYIDQHGNCPAADTELCDLHCPYRDEY